VTRNTLTLTSLSYRVCLCLRWTPRCPRHYPPLRRSCAGGDCSATDTPARIGHRDIETRQTYRPRVALKREAATFKIILDRDGSGAVAASLTRTSSYKPESSQIANESDHKKKRKPTSITVPRWHPAPQLLSSVKKAPTEKLIPVKVEIIDEHKMYSATAKSLLKTKPRKQNSAGPTQQQGILKRWNRRNRHRCLVQVALQLEFRVAAKQTIS
jgi:hypothetical protein